MIDNIAGYKSYLMHSKENKIMICEITWEVKYSYNLEWLLELYIGKIYQLEEFIFEKFVLYMKVSIVKSSVK